MFHLTVTGMSEMGKTHTNVLPKCVFVYYIPFVRIYKKFSNVRSKAKSFTC